MGGENGRGQKPEALAVFKLLCEEVHQAHGSEVKHDIGDVIASWEGASPLGVKHETYDKEGAVVDGALVFGSKGVLFEGLGKVVEVLEEREVLEDEGLVIVVGVIEGEGAGVGEDAHEEKGTIWQQEPDFFAVHRGIVQYLYGWNIVGYWNTYWEPG